MQAVRVALTLCAMPAIASAAAAGPGDSCTAEARNAYLGAVLSAVTAAWKVPYEDRYLACTVLIKQNFRGEVLNVGIAQCGDDPRVHKSVVDAGYFASPIPLPANKACFSNDIILHLESRVLDHD